jgi:hypothetical protein
MAHDLTVAFYLYLRQYTIAAAASRLSSSCRP